MLEAKKNAEKLKIYAELAGRIDAIIAECVDALDREVANHQIKNDRLDQIANHE